MRLSGKKKWKFQFFIPGNAESTESNDNQPTNNNQATNDNQPTQKAPKLFLMYHFKPDQVPYLTRTFAKVV